MAKKIGRPTKYKEEYCDMLVEHMAQGLSFESFAAIADVALSNMYEWEKKHPEFREAKKKGFDHCLLFWEKMGISGLWASKGNLFNSTVWIFNMKNRFGWRDVIDHNNNINIDGIVFDYE